MTQLATNVYDTSVCAYYSSIGIVARTGLNLFCILYSQPIHALRFLRGCKSLDRNAFGAALRDSPLFSSSLDLDALSITQLFERFSSTMNKILDEMLPARPAKSRIRPHTVWFDRDCYQLRRRTRCLERRYRRSRDTTDRLAWIGQLRALHHLYQQKEAAYWEDLVTKNSDQSKASVVYHIWTTGKIFVYFSISVLLCRYYQRMLSAKLDKLRVASATSPLPTFVLTDAVFNNFRLINDTELPPFVMVDVLDEIVPFLLYLFNRSLSEGFLPSSQKCSIIFPALKQSSLDPSLCQNYRPIANYLSFLSKTLERLVSLQLLPYLEQSGLLPSMQSGFRAHHSTETALLSLLSDIYTAMDKSHVTLLALFDASSAFDMVDHEILL